MVAALIPMLAKYWWVVAIVALLAAFKIQSTRLHEALQAKAALETQVVAMNQQNHALKAASDDCNAQVERMRKDGDSLKANLDTAVRRADSIAAAGVQAAADTMAHPPSGDCESIMRYGHQEAAQFKW